jgi:glycosyltransferase involved in cell wall biosynthesis
LRTFAYPWRVEMWLSRVVVVIPAWEPDGRLMGLIVGLKERGFAQVLVVDDGSGVEFGEVFGALEKIGVRVVRLRRNRGKGRALKTGFGVAIGMGDDVAGVVTADADGQHTVEDIVRVAETLRGEKRMVLGARRFTGAVPLRCRVGNAMTRVLFRVMTGVSVTDTQSGLRGFPVGLLGRMVEIKGERYEYEIAVLAELCRSGAAPVEVPIETLYEEGNRSSHFRPLWDSLRVVGMLVRCAVSS